MTLQLDAFLRGFIGYRQDQITNLDIEWETHKRGLDAASAAPALPSPAVLVYRVPDGGLRSKPMTEDAVDQCRQALLADIQQLGSLSSSGSRPRQRRRQRSAQARGGW